MAATAGNLIIVIDGIDGEELANVMNSLDLVELTEEPSWLDKIGLPSGIPLKDGISASRLKRFHQRSPEEIRLALQPFGYYQPAISSSLTKEADLWTARYQISLGEPVRIDEVAMTIVGAVNNQQTLLSSAQPELRRGQRLLHQDYETNKASLLQAARNLGYLNARFLSSTLLIDRVQRTADITLKLDAGVQYKFGPVEFPQEILSEELIDEFITFTEGEVFDTRKLVALQLDLSDSGYFSQAQVRAEKSQAKQDRIPVTISAVPSKKRQYTYGIGFGTDTGFRTRLGIEFRRINQRGHKVDTELLVSEVKQSVTAQYIVPFGKPGGDSLRYQSKYEQEEVGDGDAKRLSLGVSFNDRWRGWQRRFYLDYLNETFEFGSTRDTVNFLIPGISLDYRKADDLLLPRHGYSWFVDVHGGSEAIISDTNFIQGRVIGQRVWSPTERSRLLARAEYGATSVANFDALPTTERFFAGGDRSVRGYAYQDLAPEDDEGNTIGGRYLFTSSLEADYLFYNNLGGAVFADAGDASSDNHFKLSRSIGVGLRWASPVGMFRLDIARPLDEEKNFRIHIGIGADL